MTRFRLLPMVMLCALAVLGLKVDTLRKEWPLIVLSDAQAKATDDAGAKDAAGIGGQGAKDKAAADEEDQPSETAMQAGAMPDKDTSEMKNEAESDPVKPLVANNITKGELEVLQSLAARRETLEKRSEELRLRENLMAATEKRVEEKISKLKSLEMQIKKLLRQHDKEREEQIASLVKVYEKMKPKDAARIFEQLEMDILIQVTGRMREAKMAPVLAAMNPEKAKELTVELATRRRLPEGADSKG